MTKVMHRSPDSKDPDTRAFGEMARAAISALPPDVREAAGDISVQIAEFAPPEILADMRCARLQLTGLYEGIPLTEKSTADQPLGPDVIWLFRQPILAEWQDRGNVALSDLVAHVLVHELAHHFGWSDADIAKIDRWWE